jgi:hypothetical protein
METIKGVKGFDKNLKCRDFQYEIGKEYETKEKPVRCTSNGFHFCENPLDVFRYYDPTSRFCEVEGGGDVSRDDSDTKISVSKIKIGAEITLKKMVDLAVKFIFEKVNWKNEAATNTGYQSAAVTTGCNSLAKVEGESSIACGIGINNKACGKTGCWLVLSEFVETESGWDLKFVKSFKVDGKKILPDIEYELKNGKAIKSNV